MLKVQLWRPDTCGCALHQAIEDGLDENGQPNGLEHGSNLHFVTYEEAEAIVAARRQSPYWADKTTDKPQPAMVACQHHQKHGHTQQRHDVVTEENQRKNLVFKRIIETIPAFTVTDARGNIEYRLEEYEWAFDADRNLVYAVGLGTAAQIAQVRERARADHGNRVLLAERDVVRAVRDGRGR